MPPSFYALSANEQALLALLIALLLSNGLNENQLNILGNFIEAVGQNLLLIQAVISVLPNSNDTSACNISIELNAIRSRLDRLESKI